MQNSINPCFTGRQVTLLKRLCYWSQRWVQAAWAEFEHRFSTKPRKGTSAQNHEKSKFFSIKYKAMSLLWATKISPCLFCIETFHVQCQLFKITVTHQPEALFTSQGSQEVVKLLPHWGSFTFRPRYQVQQCQFIISISLQMFLKWWFAKWSQMNPNEGYQYQIDGNQRAAKNCVCAVFVPVFAHKYHKSRKFQ